MIRIRSLHSLKKNQEPKRLNTSKTLFFFKKKKTHLQLFSLGPLSVWLFLHSLLMVGHRAFIHYTSTRKLLERRESKLRLFLYLHSPTQRFHSTLPSRTLHLLPFVDRPPWLLPPPPPPFVSRSDARHRCNRGRRSGVQPGGACQRLHEPDQRSQCRIRRRSCCSRGSARSDRTAPAATNGCPPGKTRPCRRSLPRCRITLRTPGRARTWRSSSAASPWYSSSPQFSSPLFKLRLLISS